MCVDVLCGGGFAHVVCCGLFGVIRVLSKRCGAVFAPKGGGVSFVTLRETKVCA